MRRLGLISALLLTLPVFAHAESNTDPAAAPSQAALADAPQVSHCEAPATVKPDQVAAYTTACAFFTAVATRDPGSLRPTVKAPFYFEGLAVPELDDVGHRWVQLLGAFNGVPANLYGMSLYSYDEMVKKYGNPPAKLANIPMRGALIAVADVDGRAEVAVLSRKDKTWQVFAFSD